MAVRHSADAARCAEGAPDDGTRTVAALQAEVIRLRAAVMIRETALAWARDELQAVKAAIPGLPKRLALAQQVRMLEARVHALMQAESQRSVERRQVPSPTENTMPIRPARDRRKVVMWISRHDRHTAGVELAIAKTGAQVVHANEVDAKKLDAKLADADLVICQTGCVSHGDWWRVEDYCKRTGKQCVLIEQPDALQRVIASTTRKESVGAID
ncbi:MULTISPECIES: DUF2325 domain-containing protein [Burkholderia]|uniref:DUF2325 domain-containing protein n=1 Tax=Burkholderia TaxID=32008 RepID=UPI001F231B98|nr:MULTISPECIES: DUF2325 domain-containing protein [Burkholderia]